jgi:hypothetical protein
MFVFICIAGLRSIDQTRPPSGTLKVKLLRKTINLKVVGNKQFKGHKQYDQNQLMSEGERR